LHLETSNVGEREFLDLCFQICPALLSAVEHANIVFLLLGRGWLVTRPQTMYCGRQSNKLSAASRTPSTQYTRLADCSTILRIPAMIKSTRSFLSVVAAAATILLSTAVASAADAKKPNILFFVGDDMGYADVGFQGCQDIPTPHLDALAKASVRCTNGYVSGPYCSPTRAGLMTGRYQTRFGHEFNAGAAGSGLPLSETTIASRLKAAGYATGLVGKWHLGAEDKFHPQNRGFDEFFGFLGGAHDYFEDQGILRGHDQVDEKEYLTDAFGREAVAFIDKHRNETWFLYLAFNAVHTPMQADDPRLAKFAHISDQRRRTYAAMMSAMDDAIGRVRKKLDETGLAQNTLIAFISDNGGPTMPGTTVNASINKPLRGSKRTTLEGGIRVPYLVSWPGHIKAGVYDKPVIQLDLNATALTAAGVAIEPSWQLDGVDLAPFFAGTKSAAPHDTLYWRFGQQMAIRQGDYKLVRYDTNADTLTGAGGQPVSSAQLYRLSDDVGESKDLAATMPDKLTELQAKWDAWNKGNTAPLWGGGGGGEGKGKRAKQK
jgi:arylsulfatase A-like enzyme